FPYWVRRDRVDAVRIGDADYRRVSRTEHDAEGRHFLVDHRLCLRRRRKCVDDGRGDRRCASDGAARDSCGGRGDGGDVLTLHAAFGALHPQWRTPYVALLVQAAIAALFIAISQPGTTVHGAYEVLVSMGIIAYFIPFLFLFAALIRLQREPAGPDVIRVPGGPRVAAALAVVGFVTTAVSIVLACIPGADEPDKMLAVEKIVGSSLLLVAIG